MKWKTKLKVGDVFKNNEGCEYKIIDYVNANNITISFIDFNFIKATTSTEIYSGKIKNRFFPSVHKVGFFGDGEYKSCWQYIIWKDMLDRCYSGRNHVYDGCIVDEEWKNFQNFAGWITSKSEKFKSNSVNFQVDKDLLSPFNRGKIYSPSTCCLLPKELNMAIIVENQNSLLPMGVSLSKGGKTYRVRVGRNGYFGVYTTIKEAALVYAKEKNIYIREKAEKFKHLLELPVYYALLQMTENKFT